MENNSRGKESIETKQQEKFGIEYKVELKEKSDFKEVVERMIRRLKEDEIQTYTQIEMGENKKKIETSMAQISSNIEIIYGNYTNYEKVQAKKKLEEATTSLKENIDKNQKTMERLDGVRNLIENLKSNMLIINGDYEQSKKDAAEEYLKRICHKWEKIETKETDENKEGTYEK